MNLYYVDTVYGCAIREGTTASAVAAEERRSVGRGNVNSVRPATDEDIEWVRSMGGWLPERLRVLDAVKESK